MVSTANTCGGQTASQHIAKNMLPNGKVITKNDRQTYCVRVVCVFSMEVICHRDELWVCRFFGCVLAGVIWDTWTTAEGEISSFNDNTQHNTPGSRFRFCGITLGDNDGVWRLSGDRQFPRRRRKYELCFSGQVAASQQVCANHTSNYCVQVCDT